MIINKLQYEIFAGVRNREVFSEHFKQPFVGAAFGRRFELKEVPERLDLNVEEVRVVDDLSDRSKIDPTGRLRGRPAGSDSSDNGAGFFLSQWTCALKSEDWGLSEAF